MSFTSFYYIMEAFQSQDMLKATNLIKSYLEKHLGFKLYQMYGIDYFKNNKNTGEGIRYILPDDRQIRFNFNNNAISSVDIWKANDLDPSVQIDTNNISVVHILPFVVDQLNTPKTGTFDFNEDIQESLHEAKQSKKINVIPSGKNETNNDPNIPPIQKEFNTTEYADLEYVFKDLDSLVDMVANGTSYSLLITGLPGTGKSYSTIEKLQQYGNEDSFYVQIKGVTSPLGLYRTLFENNGKVIVFDDCDKILQNDDSISILKSALDNKEYRKVTWNTRINFNPDGMPEQLYDELIEKGKLPNKFMFNGRIIFITNLYQDKVDSAIKSRSFHIDVTLKRKDIITRIRQLMDKIQPNINKKYKEELLQFIEQNVNKMKRDIDIRKYDIALRTIASNTPNWQRIVINYI